MAETLVCQDKGLDQVLRTKSVAQGLRWQLLYVHLQAEGHSEHAVLNCL